MNFVSFQLQIGFICMEDLRVLVSILFEKGKNEEIIFF